MRKIPNHFFLVSSFIVAGLSGIGASCQPDFVAVSAGTYHTCALRGDKSIVCWGDNSTGNLKAPKTEDFVAIFAGNYGSCAIKEDKSIACWGRRVISDKKRIPATKDFRSIVVEAVSKTPKSLSG